MNKLNPERKIVKKLQQHPEEKIVNKLQQKSWKKTQLAQRGLDSVDDIEVRWA